jgi:hypothetical protein
MSAATDHLCPPGLQVVVTSAWLAVRYGAEV